MPLDLYFVTYGRRRFLVAAINELNARSTVRRFFKSYEPRDFQPEFLGCSALTGKGGRIIGELTEAQIVRQ